LKGFLFDENLPRRLTFAPSLPVVFSTSLGASPSDTAIWNHALQHSLVIVSKDADFSERIMLASPPPWIVHLRFGNLRLAEYHAFLAGVWPRVESLLPANKLICVYVDRLESFRDPEGNP
jgi:predicted nuclease of predicted toxin-antitoxin system